MIAVFMASWSIIDMNIYYRIINLSRQPRNKIPNPTQNAFYAA